MRLLNCLFLVLTMFAVMTAPTSAQEISFWEEFALSSDRAATLEKLVPGSEDYFYFHCIHYQNQQQLDQVDSMLKRWIKRHGKTQLVQQIQHRQELLVYSDDPKRTLKYLTSELNLHFNHQRAIPRGQKDLPEKLDPALIDPAKLIPAQLRRSNSRLPSFDDSGLWWLADETLNARQRRALLDRIKDPTFPGVVDLIALDIKGKDATKFGAMEIHRQLSKQQLEDLAKKVPALGTNGKYIDEMMLRLHPSADENMQADSQVRSAYLKRLWAFVKDLPPAFNSLKACVLYRRLELEMALGKIDRALFMTYLAIPRNASYINRELARSVRASSVAKLSYDYTRVTRFGPIGNDEALVKAYLSHFLQSARDPKAFEKYFEGDYLKRQFATAKILSGQGDRETWAAMLSPEEYQRLLERVDLDFAVTNKEFFNVDETVELDIFTKNVEKLIVKVFEINTRNYYLKYGKEIDTDISLDGLVANSQQLAEYSDSPLLRTKRSFTFDQIGKRGVYVIDFIGGGKSSRALIRKGRLQMVGVVTAAGQKFNVVDESGSLVIDAALQISGRNYESDEDGSIIVPFSTKPGGMKRQNVVITQGGFSCLSVLDPVPEQYSLRCAFHIDRESLAGNSEATVIIRPSLRVAGGNPIPLSRLKSTRLEINSVSINGTRTSKTITDLGISEAHEATATFRVPPRLSGISFTLHAKIENLLKQEQSLSASKSFTVNQIDVTNEIQDVHFLPTSQGVFLEVLGKTGEAKPGQPVRLKMKLFGLKRSITVDLQSDQDGRIALGNIGHVQNIEATLADGTSRFWNPTFERLHLSSNYHLLSGEVLTLPLPEDLLSTVDRAKPKLKPTQATLLEVRRERTVRDCFKKLKVVDGQLSIEKLEPGDYDLILRSRTLANSTRRIKIRVTEGKQAGRSLVGQHRILKRHTPSHPVPIDATVDDKHLIVQISNVRPTTRVHVFPVRYLPTQTAFDPWRDLQPIRGLEPWRLTPAIVRSSYLAGRKIGEEYQYILDRRYENRYPGNMLERPTLLLNPWSVQETTTSEQLARAGQAPGASGTAAPASPQSASQRQSKIDQNTSFANLDFLGGGQTELTNLRPDKNGQIKLTAKQIKGAQAVRVVVVDQFSAAQTLITKKLQEFEPADQRLARALDPEKHFMQLRETELLSAGQSLTISDIASSQFQPYDELADVYALYKGVGKDASNLRKFRFVIDWLEKEEDEKKTLYSQHACHELNFFIFKKDPKFFKDVVRPHLKHKRETTFMDQWLLEQDLTAWLEPWNFARLNVVEKILLSQRQTKDRNSVVRHVEQLYDLSPTPRAEFDSAYNFALLGRSMDRGQLLSQQRNFLPKLSRGLDAGGGGLGGGVAEADDDMDGLGMMMDMGQDIAKAPSSVSSKKLSEKAQLFGGRRSKQKLRQESRSRIVDGRNENYMVTVPYTENVVLGDEIARTASSLFRRVEPTKEWIENNYWRLLPTEQNAGRVKVNQFWKDYANHADGPFLSRWFTESSSNFTEMMFALAVIDLPMDDVEEDIVVDQGELTVNAAGPMIVLHQQSREVEFAPGATKIFVSENFFQANDRYRYIDGVQHDRFVEGDFRSGVLYGAEVVITNPTSSPMAIELLLQIPKGAMSAAGSQRTKTIALQLAAFSTQKAEYAFYFPTAGEFSHYPAHVSGGNEEVILAVAENRDFTVTDEPAAEDKTSWAWISQNGTSEQVVDYLKTENTLRIDLAQIAFRMNDKEFFQQAIELLRGQRNYNETLWSYSVKHNHTPALKEYLKNADRFTSQCGIAFESPMLTVDPVPRNWYEQREYSPLVNARAHRLGSKRTILNPKFFQQYEKLMKILANRSPLSSDDHLVVTYYMLLQDRVDDALEHFGKIEDKAVVASMPWAYCDAYLDLYKSQPDDAKAKAQKWVNYPFDPWRARFENVVAMVDQIKGGPTDIVDSKSREQQQDQSASSAPSFDLEVVSGATQGTGKATVKWQNLESVTVNYYQMDIEFLFSTNPFARDQLDGFSMIRPNETQTMKLKKGKTGTLEFDLPEQFANKNVLVEVVGGDQSKSHAWFANSMNVQVVESWGQILLSDSAKEGPLSKAYVKVFARDSAGKVVFHKDGYTDLRGRFDYVSQSNRSLDGITDYSILIISDENGAVIREAKPPME